MSSPQQSRSVIAEPDPGPVGPDRELALLHMPAGLRGAFAALFAIDVTMGDVVARATDPALGRIKLAWWREQLEALDGRPAPAEPRLRAVSNYLFPLGVSGREIARLEAGWATMLDKDIDADLVAERGSVLFGIGGRLLGSSDPRLAEAGALYALASVGRRGVPAMLEPARDYWQRLKGHRFERGVRPLTMLARAAARDLDITEAEGSRGRLLAMLAHRWSGRIG